MRALRSPTAFYLAMAAAVAILAAIVLSGLSEGYDEALRGVLASRFSVFGVGFWQGVSFFGSTRFLVAMTIATALLLMAGRRWWGVVQLLVVMAGALVLSNGLKWLIRRPRPDELYPDTMPASFSFPSGHSLFACVFYGALAIIAARRATSPRAKLAIWIACLAMILLIGLSRIVLGVHYPSDVLAGYFAGAFWIGVVMAFTSRPTRP
jgi:membrane-associated phospholipid phosphatase